MLYDTEDDECSDTFELEQFVTISVFGMYPHPSLVKVKYTEFDRRLIAHQSQYQSQEGVIEDLNAIYERISHDDIHNFFARSYMVLIKGEEI